MQIPAPNYTKTPNDLFDHWLPHLGEAELKVLLVIMRKTFGWHRTHDEISVSQLSKITGMLRETVISAARSLQEKGVITRVVLGKKGTQKTIYSLVVAEEDSNKSDQSVKPTGKGGGVVGLDLLGSTDSQKKHSSNKEKTATKERKDTAAAVFSENMGEKKPKIYSFLEVIDIPDSDKEEITKAYSMETVYEAVTWARSPSTVITKGLAPAIKWACKAKPELPVWKENREAKNKLYAIKYDEMKSGTTYIVVCDDYIEIAAASVNGTVNLLYSDREFMEKLKDALRKCKFPILEE